MIPHAFPSQYRESGTFTVAALSPVRYDYRVAGLAYEPVQCSREEPTP